MIKKELPYQYWTEGKLLYCKKNKGYLLTEKDNRVEWIIFYWRMVGLLVFLFLGLRMVKGLWFHILDHGHNFFSTEVIFIHVSFIFLIYVSITIVLNFWHKIKHFYSYIYIGEKKIWTLNFLKFPWIQRVSKKDIKSYNIRFKSCYTCFRTAPLSEYKTEIDLPYFFLELNLINGKKKYLNFTTRQKDSQEVLGQYLSNTQVIELPEYKANIYDIKSTSYRLTLRTRVFDLYWSRLFGYILVVILPSLFLFIVVGVIFSPIGIVGGIMLLLLFVINVIIDLIDYWTVSEILVDQFGLKEFKIGTPFIKDYQIKKEDIALISSTPLESNQYAITIVSNRGEIHELPIMFESEESAEEQIAAMKQLMKLE